MATIYVSIGINDHRHETAAYLLASLSHWLKF